MGYGFLEAGNAEALEAQSLPELKALQEQFRFFMYYQTYTLASIHAALLNHMTGGGKTIVGNLDAKELKEYNEGLRKQQRTKQPYTPEECLPHFVSIPPGFEPKEQQGQAQTQEQGLRPQVRLEVSQGVAKGLVEAYKLGLIPSEIWMSVYRGWASIVEKAKAVQ